MTITRAIFSGLLLSVILTACSNTQTTNTLPRSTPESEGVSSEGILKFIEAAEKSRHEVHSFMFLRHGKVIAEGWWSPYRPDLKHMMYSVSKSFTSTAIGFAVTEKKLSVDDKVISFFPEDLPDTISPYLAELRIKDLLCMAVGHKKNPALRGDNWVENFLAEPVVYKPGTKFLYSSQASYVLSAIIHKVTGENLIDYLTPRLFEPLGIEGMDWGVCPRGINTGGYGLRIRTGDMAKFGQLYLQEGRWNEKQLLPKEWITEATTFKIQQGPDAYTRPVPKDSSDWQQGYCYQMWRCRHNAFRADGANGQFIIVMPDQDAVIVLTSGTYDMQEEINLVWDYLIPAMHPEKLASNENMATALKQKLSSLTLPLPAKGTSSPLEAFISGKAFAFAANEQHHETVSFQFMRDTCQLTLTTNGSSCVMTFGSGAWQTSEINRRGPSLLSPSRSNMPEGSPVKNAGAYQWINEYTLELTLRNIEAPQHETLICKFDQDGTSVEMQNSIDDANKIALEGELVKQN